MFREGDLRCRSGAPHRQGYVGAAGRGQERTRARRLAKQFFDHTIVRRYYALVWGNPDADEGTIEGNIGRSPKDKLQMCVFAERRAGQARRDSLARGARYGT